MAAPHPHFRVRPASSNFHLYRLPHPWHVIRSLSLTSPPISELPWFKCDAQRLTGVIRCQTLFHSSRPATPATRVGASTLQTPASATQSAPHAPLLQIPPRLIRPRPREGRLRQAGRRQGLAGGVPA